MQLSQPNLYSDAPDGEGTWLSIGELAAETGIGVSTLRAWERRHRFPVPARLPSGHRRYPEHQVEALRAVVRRRAAGTSLAAALDEARRAANEPAASPFAALRAASPGSEPIILSAGGMLALSRAIEDEAASRADRALYIGTFQRERSWKLSASRWRALAARADLVVVLAELPRSGRRRNLWRVAVDRACPLTREWTVICDSANFTACLAGVERDEPGEAPRDRRYDALWTVDPAAVRGAARAALTVGVAAVPDLEAALAGRPAGIAEGADPVSSATRITNRLLAASDRASRRS